MARGLEDLQAESWSRGYAGSFPSEFLAQIFRQPGVSLPVRSLLIWLSGGVKSAFLQDADSMVVKPEDLATILRALKETFPSLERVTCYARSQTLARRSMEELRMLKEAGLDRVHVGLESGSDEVLKMVKKGCTATQHVEGGGRVMEAGLELSEYVMPGLGGRALSDEHAVETARVLNAINPHFIRLRTLAVPRESPLEERVEGGEFECLSETQVVEEIRIFTQHLEGIHSYLVSDHILNLLMEVEGELPEDKETILAHLDRFLTLTPREQEAYIIGRRSGLFRCLDDTHDPLRRQWAEERALRLKEQGRFEETVRDLMRRFI
jgi:radical SAM superfamily enzyme YgiQ (UPF0313 family)